MRRLMDFKREKRRFWKMTLFTMFLIYPHVSSSVLRFFSCEQINGVWYLYEDFTLECYTPEYNSYYPMVIFFVLLYPLGVPAFFMYELNRYHKRFGELDIKMQLGFLFEPYSSKVWYFEIIEMTYKIAMTGLLAFLPGAYQMPTAMCLCVVFLLVLLLGKPYHRSSDEQLHMLCQVETLLLVSAGHIILVIGGEYGLDERTDFLLSILLIGIGMSVVVLFFYLACYAIVSMIQHFVTAHEEKTHERPCHISFLQCCLKCVSKSSEFKDRVTDGQSKAHARYFEDMQRREFERQLAEQTKTLSEDALQKQAHDTRARSNKMGVTGLETTNTAFELDARFVEGAY
jgi:hypothetical protein